MCAMRLCVCPVTKFEPNSLCSCMCSIVTCHTREYACFFGTSLQVRAKFVMGEQCTFSMCIHASVACDFLCRCVCVSCMFDPNFARFSSLSTKFCTYACMSRSTCACMPVPIFAPTCAKAQREHTSYQMLMPRRTLIQQTNKHTFRFTTCA